MNNCTRNPLYIAIPSNDGKTIFSKMLGMAKYFYIYKKIDARQFKLVEKRDNPYEKTMQHLKTLDVYSVISECKIILAAHIGKKGIERLQDKGVKLYLMKGYIREALNSINHSE